MTSTDDGLSADERTAVKQAAAERRRSKAGKNDEASVLEAIASMDAGDRAIAEGLHALVGREFPGLTSKTWYGFPAYCQDGAVVFFFQYAGKFKSRYGHIGFQDVAQLDDGVLWPTAYAVTAWDAQVEEQIARLIRRAVGQDQGPGA